MRGFASSFLTLARVASLSFFLPLLYDIASTILIEDKASGTQLIQELVSEGIHAVQKYEPKMDKIMRLHSITSTIENGFAHVPDRASWLAEYLLEITTFPKGKYDDQTDSTSQALEWFKQHNLNHVYGVLDYFRKEAATAVARNTGGISHSPLVNRGAFLREYDRMRGPFRRY
jgi:hypothetical protein